jgi:gliding motility-associated-like protein
MKPYSQVISGRRRLTNRIFATLLFIAGLFVCSFAQTGKQYAVNLHPNAISKASPSDSLIDPTFSDTIIEYFTPWPDGPSSIKSIPNIFNPGSDGKNNSFYITSDNLKALNCTIFNRWGNTIHTITTPDGSWTGTNSNGQPCAAGVYYYTCSALGKDDVIYSRQGFIELFR